ncbi:MAG: queuosine precursor transporter [Bacteroidetes bacterium]|nr:queuosine precursor transporter [Bacteroidota bacterium]
MDRRTKLLIILFAIFLTSAITAELVSSKLFVAHIHIGSFEIGSFVSIIGIIPWPVVFLVTDTINEFYGPKVLRSVSFLTAFMIALCFVIVYIAMLPHAFVPPPPANAGPHWKPNVANDEQFNRVFGQSQWIIAGSITAFIIGQLVDSFVFWFFRKRTGGKMIWLRSTGSTVISQLVDSFVVLYIAFVIPGTFSMSQFWSVGITNYFFKLMIAIGLTPLIYLGHWMVEKYLGNDAHFIEEKVAEEALNEKI